MVIGRRQSRGIVFSRCCVVPGARRCATGMGYSTAAICYHTSAVAQCCSGAWYKARHGVARHGTAPHRTAPHRTDGRTGIVCGSERPSTVARDWRRIAAESSLSSDEHFPSGYDVHPSQQTHQTVSLHLISGWWPWAASGLWPLASCSSCWLLTAVAEASLSMQTHWPKPNEHISYHRQIML